MTASVTSKRLLGINGLGRIGKLTLWNFLYRRHFDGVIINMGREVGKSVDDLIQVMESDSTYGSLGSFLYGHARKPEIRVLDESTNVLLDIDGMMVKVLREARNPKEINWRREGVRLVIDTTGQFTDPTHPADFKSGSLRGHLEGGAEKVINSAPFKIKDKSLKMPNDCTCLIFGINHTRFDPVRHHILSAASCTTTGLAHLIKPLLETEETSQILTASMSTIHAATNTQSVLDAVPKAGATDLRKSRSVMNNIILSTTGSAKALEEVLPEIKQIGFMADAVRVPTSTVSLIILNITFHSPLDKKGQPVITQSFLNNVYRKAAEGAQKDMLIYSERQNVSSDLIGVRAAVVVEGHENHTRTGFVALPPEALRTAGVESDKEVRIPVTHAKLFGWYDNEFGSYVNCMGELAIYMDKNMG
ncbi:MAG TPA: glyceraldehyde 3-phosphate dehydrogenase NAD-binding domain-containing protein [Geobacteraceae bacterium]|nr:glyceraldehyde 3-phosphate dehydrogenase NAD-binding domain-containing protein [Geobacteraceae bacterium]